MTLTPSTYDDEFLATSVQAMRASSGPEALDTLGWWELLPELHDATARAAVFALFRAQGRELGSSPALGGLMAQPYLATLEATPGTVVATIGRCTRRRGEVTVAVGEVADMKLLIDRPGRGISIIDASAAEFTRIEVPGRLDLWDVTFDEGDTDVVLDDARATATRQRSRFLGRVAAGFEILGAAERSVAVAVDYAGAREQFGQPIGRFQAVRHLLAWATTDCVAIERVASAALTLDRAAPARYDEIVKALAGRNGRRACQRSLQVLGGIGFTAEHDHHHHASRVLALDSLLGSSARLTHGLGTRLREDGTDPELPRAALTALWNS